MSRPAATAADTEISLVPSEGWHCGHFFYSFDRGVLQKLSPEVLAAGRQQFCETLNPTRDGAPIRLQTSIVSGGKADLGLMLLDPDPLKVDAVHQQLLAGSLGPAIRVDYSYVSLTEISEYVPSLEQYGEQLVEGGEEEGGPRYQAKMKAYEAREKRMRIQRLTPEFPAWPATCFYPMSKKRKVGENWFALPFEDRYRMMLEHGRSGMQFAGKVTQLITVSVGLDDWEWGVTLWARNPEFLKEIVYKMRFDQASALYAEFGPFYTSYVSTAEEVLAHCRVGV